MSLSKGDFRHRASPPLQALTATQVNALLHAGQKCASPKVDDLPQPGKLFQCFFTFACQRNIKRRKRAHNSAYLQVGISDLGAAKASLIQTRLQPTLARKRRH